MMVDNRESVRIEKLKQIYLKDLKVMK